MTPAVPAVSVVLPCYRAAAVARRSVDALGEWFATLGVAHWEVIVVDDGGGDFPPDPWHTDARVRLLRLPHNQGKGAALRAGLAAARGEYRLFTDVDLPYGTAPLAAMLATLQAGSAELVIGDRTLQGSHFDTPPGLLRRMASKLASLFIGRVVASGYPDTQCGCKGISGAWADALLPRCHVDGFAIDVELLQAALDNRLRIARLPVRLLHNGPTTVRLWRDLPRSGLDVLRIKLRSVAHTYVVRERPRAGGTA